MSNASTNTVRYLSCVLQTLDEIEGIQPGLAPSFGEVASRVIKLIRGLGATDPSYIPPRYMPLWTNCPVDSMHHLLSHPAVDPAVPSTSAQVITHVSSHLTEEAAQPSPRKTVENSRISCSHANDNSQFYRNIEATPTSSVAAPLPQTPRIAELYQELYNKGAPIDGPRVETVHFMACGRRGLPVNALNNIDNGDNLAFPICAPIKMKVALRFGFMSHEVKQVNVRRIDDTPVTIKTMSRTIVRTLERAVKEAEQRGEHILHNGQEVRFEQLVLLRLEHVAQGSLQPVVGVLLTN